VNNENLFVMGSDSIELHPEFSGLAQSSCTVEI
jgi:hypothetical protein